MRRLFLLTISLLMMFSFAVADEYFELKPGFVTTLSYEGVGFYSSPSIDANTGLRIGSGVCMLLTEILDNGWGAIRFLRDGSPVEGYIRTASLVMNDYGLGYDAVRLVSAEPDQAINLYEQPNESSKVYGQYFTGTLVTLYEKRNDGFARVAIGEVVGYVLSQYLFPYEISYTSADLEAMVFAPDSDGVSLSGINQESAPFTLDPICYYPNGTKVVVLGITPENWCHVIIDGRTGYIFNEKLQPLVNFVAN